MRRRGGEERSRVQGREVVCRREKEGAGEKIRKHGRGVGNT